MSAGRELLDKIEKASKLTDEQLDSLILEYTKDRGMITAYTRFSRSLNSMKEAEDLGRTLYRWSEKYEDLLDVVASPKVKEGASFTPAWNLDARSKAEAYVIASDLI